MKCTYLILLYQLGNSLGFNLHVPVNDSSNPDQLGANLFLPGVGGVLSDVLATISSHPRCSVILFSDTSLPHLSLAKEIARLSPKGGISIMEMYSDGEPWRGNFTSILESARFVRMSSWCTTLVIFSLDLNLVESVVDWMDKERLAVWATRIIVVTSLNNRDVENLLESHWLLSMMNTILVNLHSRSKHKYDVYSYLPYTHRGSKAKKVFSWMSNFGFNPLGISLFQEKYKKSAVNMTVFPFPPYWMTAEKVAPNGTSVQTLTGRDYIMLETVADVLNFTINVLPDGEWEEVMKRLEDRTAFLSPLKLAMMPQLLKFYDFTVFIERATLGFSMAKPTLKPQWQSLYYPLTDLVWLTILAVLILIPIMLLMVTRIGSFGCIRDHFSLNMIVLEVIGALLGQTLSKRWQKTNSTRVVLGVWLIFSVIIGAAYRGNLTAFLTIPKYPARPETAKQLMNVGATLTMPPDLVDFFESFKNSKSKLFQTLAERVNFVPDFHVGMKQAIKKNSAYVYERFYLELMIVEHFTEIDGSSRLYVAQENIVPSYCGWPMIRDAPFKQNLDEIIMYFHEAGLVQKWSNDILKEARLNSRKKKMTQEQDLENETSVTESSPSASGIMALTIIHMQGPFFLLLLGLLLSSVIFLGEVIGVLCCKKIINPVQ